MDQRAIYVTYLGNFLSVHGWNPTVAESLVPRLKEAGLPVEFASSKLGLVPRMVDMLIKVLTTPRTNSCIIIDLYSGPRAFLAARVLTTASRLLGRKYILVLHGGGLPDRWNRSRRSLFQMLYHAAAVVSPSPFLANFFGRYVYVEIIPNGISVTDYPWKLRKAVQPKILYLRAFHKYYDPKTAIEAFYRFKSQYGDGYFTMAGPDEDGTLKECKSLVERLGLRDSVRFLGRVPKSEIPRLGIEHDIFVNSSRVDNTPVSTIEAMAMGLCIVATSAGGLPYLLDDEQTALLVPPGDPDAMAEAMLRLVREPELACRLSASARAVAERMDWSNVIPQWLSLIRRVAHEGDSQ